MRESLLHLVEACMEIYKKANEPREMRQGLGIHMQYAYDQGVRDTEHKLKQKAISADAQLREAKSLAHKDPLAEPKANYGTVPSNDTSALPEYVKPEESNNPTAIPEEF